MINTVTRKGQVTIPKPIRDYLGIKPGMKVAFNLDQDGRAFIRAEGEPQPKQNRFEHLRGTATTHLRTDDILAMTRGKPA